MQTSRRHESPQLFEELDALRELLPAFWWDEVSRVRALVRVDAEQAFREARHFDFAAREIARVGQIDHAQLVALTIVAAQLKRLAWAQIARA